MDEINMAGASGSSNSSYYLYTGSYYWSLSPSCFYYGNGGSIAFTVSSPGSLTDYYGVNDSNGVRPSVVLRHGIEVLKGDGSVQSPFQFQLE